MGNLKMAWMWIFITMIFLSSCVNDSSKEGGPAPAAGGSPVNLLKAIDINPPAFDEDSVSLITLNYSDKNARKAQSCSLSSLNKVTIAQACACDGAGVCSVSVRGSSNAFGSGSFRYNVAIGGEVSSTGLASFTINPLDDAPITSSISPASFKYNTQSILTLAYNDADNDRATGCTIASLTNVTVSQACSCSLGVCTVGVTGTNNYIGSASFTFTVTANSVISNSSSASLTIVGDPPVASNVTPAAFPTNTQSVIILSYTDAQSDPATSCSVSSLRNVYVSQGCACSGGICGVGVTSLPNYTGSADFKFTVTAAGQTSNQATASLTVIPSTPVAANITPAAFNEDVASIITLSYTDPLNRKATACAVTSTSNVTVNQACACDGAGLCTVGVKGNLNYNGSASFGYTVTAGGQVSNSATASLTVNPVDDSPITSNVTLMDLIYEDTQSGFLALSYTDVDGDRAGVNDCTISNPTNLTITTACSCDVILGSCSLKITGNLHYYGPGSFDYKVKTNAVDSNISTADLTILHKDHAPTTSSLTPAAFDEETQSVITLSYTDIDNDKAASCSLTSLSNITITQACACDVLGVCTVGVTGTANYSGAASFYYTVTANGAISNSSSVIFNINNLDDAPVSAAITPPAFDQNAQSIITLSYTDPDNDKATTCSVSALTNVTETQACACDAGGICTVGVTGTLNYSGAAAFNYTVTANSVVSNSSAASLTINPLNIAPSIDPIATSYGNENTAYVLNFTIDDANGPIACSSAVTTTASTNTTLIPIANIVFGGAYPNCTATITPASNEIGSSNLTFRVTDPEGLFDSVTFTHNVRNGVSQTWLLGDVGDSMTYSYSSALIESVAPGVIRLAPFNVDQTDNDSSVNGFTAIPSTLRWDSTNSYIWQNHAVGAWTLASGFYSTSYTSRIMDAKKPVSWNSIAWNTSLPFGKELTLTNESSAEYSQLSGALANSLVGLWHFNEGAGSTAIKNSKTGNAESFLVDTPSPAALGQAGRLNMAVQFNGNTVLKSATSSAVTPGTFTISTWVKKSGATAENVICFWTTNDSTVSDNCPVRIANSLRMRINGTNYLGNTSITDGNWHHVIVTSNSLTGNSEAYIDGVLENFGSQPPSFTTAGSALYFGNNVGTSGNYAGGIDETAIWNRVLTSTEITEVYRRGANRLFLNFRTCPDATCSTNPAWSTAISEADNVVNGEPLTASPNFTIGPSAQRYFQYKVTFESDNVPSVSSPDLRSVVVGPAHAAYSANEEQFVTQEGLSFKSLASFTATLGAQGCSGGGIRYQLSKDKINWSYYNGTTWATGTNYTTSSTSGQLQSGLSSYTSTAPGTSDVVYVRGTLKSDVDGASPCEIDQLQLSGHD